MATAIRIGILNDMAAAPPGPSSIEPWLQREVDALRSAGRLDRDVEFVHAWGLGLPSGTAAAVERAYAELDAQDVLMIVGPAIGDNALVATPLAESRRIPTLNWAGAERARGDWMFHLQVGSHEDESILIAQHLAERGLRRIAVAYDRSEIGRRHLDYLQAEAEVLGITIAASAGLHPLTDDASAALDALLAPSPVALVYLGLGLSAPAVALGLRVPGWEGPRFMNTAGLRGYHADFARTIDGWHYVDMHSDGNRCLTALRETLGIPALGALAAAKGHDLGRLVAEGLARSSSLTRAGLRDGLERIKWLPAAEGEDGTLLGFGRQDRGALHGRYLAMRRWQQGQSLEVPRLGADA